MDHEHGILSKFEQSVSDVNEVMNMKETTTQPDRLEKFQRPSSSISSDIEQKLGDIANSLRNRRRESMLRRHEQYLSTRPSLSGSFLQKPSLRISRLSVASQPSSEYLVLENHINNEEEEPKHESTPLIGSPLLASESPHLASTRCNYNSTSGKSQSFRRSMQQQQQIPHFKSTHWATIKKNIHQGTFLVSDLLSKESGLLAMDSTADEKENAYTGKKRTTEELRQRAIENFQKGSTFSPQLCLLAILLYLIVAVLMFCFVLEPQWTVIDSCYFAVSTFTTLGYGDLSPTSTMSVIFTTLYALAGVACLGLALGILGSLLLETKEIRMCQEKLKTEFEALTMFDHDDNSNDDYYKSDDDCMDLGLVSDDKLFGENETHDRTLSTTLPDNLSQGGKGKESNKKVVLCTTVKKKTLDREESKNSSVPSAKLIDSRTTYGVGKVRFVLLLSIAMIFATLIGYQSGWGFWSTFYYAVTTAATIGKNRLGENVID
jgi:hypothetical protein